MNQTGPDNIQTNPDPSRPIQTQSGSIQTDPDKNRTGPDTVHIDPNIVFPSPPYIKTIDDAFLLFSKEGLVERRRTVTRWAKKGLFDAIQDLHDRKKWWLTEESINKKFRAHLKRKKERLNRKNTIIDHAVSSSGGNEDVLRFNEIEQDLGTKEFPSLESEADSLKKQLAAEKIARQRAEQNIEGMDQASVNIGFGFSQSMQLAMKEKILLEQELKRALPLAEFNAARNRINSEVEAEVKLLIVRTQKKLELDT